MARKRAAVGAHSISQYVQAIESDLRRGNATEHTHRPALKALLESLVDGVSATNEPAQRTDCGAPDMVVSKRPGPVEIGWVECKDVGTSLPNAFRSNQLKRYLKALPNLILTDYIDFKWFVNGEEWGSASLGSVNATNGRINTNNRRMAELLEVLEGFLAESPAPITKPKDLAQRMAALAHMVRDIVIEAFARNKASQITIDLRKAMAQVLIPDLEEHTKTGQFADLFAQTVTYGLFAAACNHPGHAGPFTRTSASRDIPPTNPFLRRLFTTITGPDLDNEPYAGVVDSLVSILATTHIWEILKDFGSETAQKDPVLHFYETFLATYDPEERNRRGVFYTPTAVVRYIVGSVDHILKARFDIPEGLADSARVPATRGTKHRVLILDPACGTGTFLYETVLRIRESFQAQNRSGMWSGYVKDHLLPRLHGFELLMAPYAVAHFKLGMELAAQDLPEVKRDTWAYDFATDERLKIYLTNTLEAVERHVQELLGPYRAISDEALAAKEVKRDLPILVCIGNPPYSNSVYEGSWIMSLLNDYRVGARERRSHITREEWKFLRFAHHRIMDTGHGVIGFIINNSFVDATSLRGMRQSLITDFTEIYVLNLLGSVRGHDVDRYPDDQNVFDIEQGVAVLLLVRSADHANRAARVFYEEIGGSRDAKYEYLCSNDLSTTNWTELDPIAPNFYMFRLGAELGAEYGEFVAITSAMPMYSSGIQTKRDELAVQFTRSAMESTVTEFAALGAEEARQRFSLPADNNGWSIARAQADIASLDDPIEHVCRLLYRPFDLRYTVWTGVTSGFHGRPRREVMQHVVRHNNVCLLFNRQISSTQVSHFLASRVPCCHGTMYLGHRGQDYCAPLYRYATDQAQIEHWPEGESGQRPNLDPAFVNRLGEGVGLNFIIDSRGDLESTFGPEDVLHYIYAIFHCPTYRERYADFLKLDFPRVPVTSDKDLFVTLCKFGGKVMALHLLEDPALSGRSIGYPVTGDNIVARRYPKYVPPGSAVVRQSRTLRVHRERGRVYINPTQFFEGVESDVWKFQIGGYQVAEKWLSDRRDSALSHDDIIHYARAVEALRGTIALMAEIDDAISEWPIA